MSFVFQRHLKDKTKLSVAQNLRFRGDCNGIKYIMVTVVSWRFTFTWKEKRRHYPSVVVCGYMRS